MPLSPEQILDWREFWRLTPFGFDVDQLLVAQLTQQVAATGGASVPLENILPRPADPGGQNDTLQTFEGAAVEMPEAAGLELPEGYYVLADETKPDENQAAG